jgi:PEP-CTERM motif
MRRVILLALLALALPTATLASSIGVNDYGNSGVVGVTAFTAGSAAAGQTYGIFSAWTSLANSSGLTTGNLGTVSVTTGVLSGSGGNFTFTGGTILIRNTSSAVIFSGTFNGTLTSSNGVVSITYAPGGVPIIGGFQISAAGVVSGNTIVTPEPGTLGLLGTGLVGLAGIVRRKLRG